MLSVNGLFQLDWDLSPVNKLQSAIHFVAQSYHLFGTLSQMLQHGARDQAAYFLRPKYFSRGMHREFTTGKLAPRPRRRAQSSISCMQAALYLSRRVFTLKLAARVS